MMLFRGLFFKYVLENVVISEGVDAFMGIPQKFQVYFQTTAIKQKSQ